MWGSNKHGQLGLEANALQGRDGDEPHAATPTCIKALRGARLVGVALGNRHTIVWGHAEGEALCYVFGENRGQLGLPEPSRNVDADSWQPRKVSHISGGRYVIRAVSTTSLLTACLTTNDDVVVFKDYVCRKIMAPGTRFPKHMPSPHNVAAFSEYSKVACARTTSKVYVAACVSKVGNLYLWVHGRAVPVIWDVARRTFAVKDVCLGQDVDGTDTVTVAVVAEDALVYTARLGVGRKTAGQECLYATPRVVKGVFQVKRLWAGPQMEHMLCVRAPRDGVVGAAAEARAAARAAAAAEVSAASASASAASAAAAHGGAKVTVSAGGESCDIAVGALMQSPFFSACLSGRWDDEDDEDEDDDADADEDGGGVDGGGKEVAPLPRRRIELPVDFDGLSQPKVAALLNMLAAYLENGTAHVEVAAFESAFNLLVIADALLLDDLKSGCVPCPFIRSPKARRFFSRGLGLPCPSERAGCVVTVSRWVHGA